VCAGACAVGYQTQVGRCAVLPLTTGTGCGGVWLRAERLLRARSAAFLMLPHRCRRGGCAKRVLQRGAVPVRHEACAGRGVGMPVVNAAASVER